MNVNSPQKKCCQLNRISTTLTEGAGIHREMMMMRKQLDRLEASIRSQG